MSTDPALLCVAPEVEGALRSHRPVVALETTLVTHGLPRPQGFETALVLEAEVLAAGAVPATIGVLDGAVRVGLSRDELQRLADARDVAKCNPGNLAAQVASGRPGSTTVASTVFVAARCGIPVFATGGIGGVHRGERGDISADLVAIARHPVAVVCAGAKAILDLPRTSEALETAGVPRYGIGTDTFPAFWRRSSGLPLDRRYDDMDALARAIRTHWALGARGGVLVGNPIPEADELPLELYESALAEVLAEADRLAVTGRDVTPFMLERLRELTGGASVRANLVLLRHNARVAGALAVALARHAEVTAAP
jgi:pseudouridine-5'-phosphate glycosidase